METVIAAGLSAIAAIITCVINNNIQRVREQAAIERKIDSINANYDKQTALITQQIVSLTDHVNKHNNVVDWKQLANFEVGDVVYIYCTKPEMRIRYKMEVVETNIPFSKSLKDEDCWTDKGEYKSGIENNKYFRMQLTCYIDTDNLTIMDLHTHGIKGWIQRPRKLSFDDVSYIERSIKKR